MQHKKGAEKIWANQLNNLLEYKSPTDHRFNAFAIAQALSYAYYYCDRYQTWDVTISLVVSKKHFNLLKWLGSQGMAYTKRHAGIYTQHGISLLKMQIIVVEELRGDTFKWLSVLTDKLTEANAKKFVATANGLREMEDRKLADSIMQVLLSANGKVFEKIKEDDTMSAALMELMKPEVEKYAEDYARKKDVERAKIMIQGGEGNEYIKLLTQLTDKDIDELRKAAQ